MECNCSKDCDCSDNVVYLEEFYDDNTLETSNEFLSNGWKLIHVGTKLISILENGQAYYNTAYVVGATQKQYDVYLKSLTESDL